ncbi:hypothetical protein TorRG33x02_261420, partial [Trema orientale]
EEPTGGVPDQRPGGGAKPTQALQIRGQSTNLDAIPGDAGVDRHVRDGHRRRQTDEAAQRHRRGQPSAERDHGGGECADDAGEDEVGAAAVALDGEDVGHEAPDGLHDPGDGVEARVELDHRGLDLLDVFPVVVGDHFEERAREALVEAVDQDHAEDEARV